MQVTKTSNTKEPLRLIRPAGTLLLVREGVTGIEVLGLKRSANMRFLPGHIAFPGGAVDPEDFAHVNARGAVSVTAQEQADDPVYAAAALRECAEEIGWACAMNQLGAVGDFKVSTSVQQQLLGSELSYSDWVRNEGYTVDFSRLRFVGRWVTPPFMPVRFDTRFFLYEMQSGALEPNVSVEENEWAKWLSPKYVLQQLSKGECQAAPPTVAMFKGLSEFDTVDSCFDALCVPGPPPED